MRYSKAIVCRVANILARSMIRSRAFHAAWAMAKGQDVEKVAGVLYGHRQSALQHLTWYPAEAIRFHLVRESGNRYDGNAVAVTAEVVGRGMTKMGSLESGTAALLAPVMDRGVKPCGPG